MRQRMFSTITLLAMAAWFSQGCNAPVNGYADEADGYDQSQGALIGPDQDLDDFPPWIWPIIHPADILANVVTGVELPFGKAAELIKLSATKLCECSTTGKYQFGELMDMINAGFDIQYAALRFAQIKAIAGTAKAAVRYDDGDWCGTPPKPWPWPRPWLELVRYQIEVFTHELPRWYDLNRMEMNMFKENLHMQMSRFEKLAE